MSFHHKFLHSLGNVRNSIGEIQPSQLGGGKILDTLRGDMNYLCKLPWSSSEQGISLDRTLAEHSAYSVIFGRIDHGSKLYQDQIGQMENKNNPLENLIDYGFEGILEYGFKFYLEALQQEIMQICSMLNDHRRAFAFLKRHIIRRISFLGQIRCLPSRGNEKASLMSFKSIAGVSMVGTYIFDQILSLSLVTKELKSDIGWTKIDYLFNAIGGSGGLLLFLAENGC